MITINALGLVVDVADGAVQMASPALPGTVAILDGPGTMELPLWYQGRQGTLEIIARGVSDFDNYDTLGAVVEREVDTR